MASGHLNPGTLKNSFIVGLTLGLLTVTGQAAETPQQAIQTNTAKANELPKFKGASESVLFSENFESGTEFLDFLKADASRFTHFNRVPDSNKIEFTKALVAQGKQSLMLAAEKSGRDVSKASLEKEGLDFRDGDIVKLSGLVFIPANQKLKDLFLFDLECITCWPKGILKNQHMGIRLMLRDDLGFVSVERGKIGFRKEPFYPIKPWKRFPENRWVQVDWVLNLSTITSGDTNVYIDNVLTLTTKGINMPSTDVIHKLFKLDLTLPLRYDKFEFGITANGSDDKTTLYMDNISISVLDKMPQ